ncbi:hypothetical protein I8H83_04130 [Candidatus Saccharibacteria bacterium]|nr:hypothetical protein [Candidatus Saccharibacteria bacterium]
MNDDDKKPVNLDDDMGSKDEKGFEEDTSVKVTFGGADIDTDSKSTDKEVGTKKKDESADLLVLDDEHDTKESDFDSLLEVPEPEEEISEVDRELGRIEGIESVEISKPVVDELIPDGVGDSKLDSDKDLVSARDEDGAAGSITGPVDLGSKDLGEAKENPVVLAMRKQEQEKKQKGSKTGLVALVFSILLVAALGVGAYFYMQSTDASNKITELEASAAAAETTNATLRAQIKAGQAEQQHVAAASSEYRTIGELGVRFKDTDATKAAIFGYTAVPTDGVADAVAVSTKPLARLAVGAGASATYPCAFTGNVPTIARYETDAKIGNGSASTLGKKIGDIYYVYTAPTGNCAPTEAAAQAARNATAKAIYDSLEAIPAATVTQQNSTSAGSSAATSNSANPSN